MTNTTSRPAKAGFFFGAFILAILLGLLAPAYGAGTIPYSLSQQIATNGTPLSGCKLFIIQAGTPAAPQNAFSDSGLTTALPNPIICDASGRLPQFFLADGLIKIRLTDKNGVTQVTADNIQVIGPSGGGGGGGVIDATTILATGDLKVRYGTGILTGFVRANGRTIGSATSGATERANADAEALFEYLWGADANLAVAGGRGASANADWIANKTLTLPDWRGRLIAGLDDMGNTSAARLSSILSSTILGAAGGAQQVTLGTGNLPPYTPSGTVSVALNDPGHSHASTNSTTPLTAFNAAIGVPTTSPTQSVFPVSSFQNLNGFSTSTNTTGITVSSSTFSGNGQGGASTPFNIAQPTMLATIYLKL